MNLGDDGVEQVASVAPIAREEVPAAGETAAVEPSGDDETGEPMEASDSEAEESDES